MPALITQERVWHESTSPTDEKEVHTPQKRVLLGDDNPAILDIIRSLVQPEYLVVGAVTDGKSVLREAAALKPDIVILDISMGEPDGIGVARRLLETSCHVKVVFLTVHERAEFVRAALAAGGTAYVFKSRLSTDLIPALHAACSGRLFVSCRNV